MRLHYDNIVFSLQQAGGISTYWAELISRLIRDEIDVTYEEFRHQNIARNTLMIQKNSINLSKEKHLFFQRFKTIPLAAQKQPFIFHSSYNRTTNNPHASQVATVHDFVHEKFYNGLRRKLHLMQKKRMLKEADQVITVSENTKRDLLEYHPYLNEKNVTVIYNGVSSDFHPLNSEQKELISNTNEKPYLLFVGSREHYKNFNFTIDLLKKSEDFTLYIVGSVLHKEELRQLQFKIPGRWKHFHNVTNQKLNELYNSAYALIYPSVYEGFGIPLLEAMKAGTPFLALNNSSIPEVAGSAGLLIETADISLFQQALNDIEYKREDLLQKGYLQAANFSWEKSYQQTLSVYKKLMP